MLNQLAAFGQSIRGPNDSDALKEEFFSVDLIIDAEGRFLAFNDHDKRSTFAEAITAKKGKARLLLDKAEEVLNLEPRKHTLFLNKLAEYKHLKALDPVWSFYHDRKDEGMNTAREEFNNQVPEKLRSGNLAFQILNEDIRLHEKPEIQAEIIAKFQARQQAKKTTGEKLFCSICGKSDYPISQEPHGMIKKVPQGQPAGSALVSYNENAFCSYGLESNQNSSICTACARNYVEGLNYLLSSGDKIEEVKNGKKKAYTKYKHRKDLSPDTALIYWTRHNRHIPEIDYLDDPDANRPAIISLSALKPPEAGPPDESELLQLLNSPFKADVAAGEVLEAEAFYCCALSGADARVFIRSWVESTTDIIKKNVQAWFHEMAITAADYGETKTEIKYLSIRALASACAIHRKKEVAGQVRYERDRSDSAYGRMAALFWNCALLGQALPKTVLARVLRRVRTEQGRVTPGRAAVIKLYLNRMARLNNQGEYMPTELDRNITDTAYVAGRIFAMLESIQWAAQGDLNAGIRERFFSAASTNPSITFGRLFKLSQHHLSKMRGEKPFLATKFDNQLAGLCGAIKSFPATFSLEAQGRFALGYYHQRQDNFNAKQANNKEQK